MCTMDNFKVMITNSEVCINTTVMMEKSDVYMVKYMDKLGQFEVMLVIKFVHGQLVVL
jgi:hypothetical protein